MVPLVMFVLWDVVKQNKYFQFKQVVGHWGAPELELPAVVIVLFTPILHETLTNSNFDTNTICQLTHGSSTAVNSSQFLSDIWGYILQEIF